MSRPPPNMMESNFVIDLFARNRRRADIKMQPYIRHESEFPRAKFTFVERAEVKRERQGVEESEREAVTHDRQGQTDRVSKNSERGRAGRRTRETVENDRKKNK